MEKMQNRGKRNLIIVAASIIAVAGIGAGAFLLMKTRGVETEQAESGEKDALKFKTEYESLNGTEKNGNTYLSVTIDEENPIEYVDAKRALEILKGDGGVLYVGANWCPWCRNAVPALLAQAYSMSVEKIYYLNLDDEKSLFEIQDGEAKQTRKGTDDYYALLEFLGDRLKEYTLTDEEGNEIDTGEKRIYMPYVVGAKDGEIVADHTGTVELEEGQTAYDELDSNQQVTLMSIYDGILQLAPRTCVDICN